jgi:hypothetical protein
LEVPSAAKVFQSRLFWRGQIESWSSALGGVVGGQDFSKSRLSKRRNRELVVGPSRGRRRPRFFRVPSLEEAKLIFGRRLVEGSSAAKIFQSPVFIRGETESWSSALRRVVPAM